MPIYRIAGLNVKLDPEYERLKAYAEQYKSRDDEAVPDFSISFEDGYLEKKQSENPALSLSDCEYMWAGAAFAGHLLEYNGLVLHASAVEYEGRAYLFSAPCGTGKSTHTSLWQKTFGYDKTSVINDDKPAIRFSEGKYMACGTPFSGKSPVSKNTAVPLRGICFISQSQYNYIERISPEETIPLIMEQTLRPHSGFYMGKLLDVLSDLLSSVPVFKAGLDMSAEAVYTTYNAMRR